MQISLSDTGKRFNREWIFRKLSYQFAQGRSYAITGPNGSGKSTLLQVVAGSVMASEGKIDYRVKDKPIDPAGVYRYVSIAAPYLELVEEMTLREFLDFHKHFKPLLPGWDTPAVIASVGLQASADKQIRYYSSGMKQRVKLAQAVFSDTPCLLLDEPCTNFDTEGIALYQRLINEHSRGRLLIICSNDKTEYEGCERIVDMLAFK